MTLPRFPFVLLAASYSLVMSAPAVADINGKEFFILRCSSCHGTQGQGTRHLVPPLGPALKGNPFIINGSAAAIRTVIRKGRAGRNRLYDDAYPNMPAFGTEAIPDAEPIIAYLKGELQK